VKKDYATTARREQWWKEIEVLVDGEIYGEQRVVQARQTAMGDGGGFG
jgi:hypothetical protein